MVLLLFQLMTNKTRSYTLSKFVACNYAQGHRHLTLGQEQIVGYYYKVSVPCDD